MARWQLFHRYGECYTDPAVCPQHKDDLRQRYPWLDTLATYNAERARGIVHTQDWDERMAKYQAEFDADANG